VATILLAGELTVEQIHFDSFITSAMHLTGLTGHSWSTGISRLRDSERARKRWRWKRTCPISLSTTKNVKLENVGPVRLTYRQDEVRVEQANLRGTDTDFHVAGSARFAGDRALSFARGRRGQSSVAGGFRAAP